MTKNFTACVWREDNWYIAQCLEIDIASQGTTEEEALVNLEGALEPYFEPPTATFAPQIFQIQVNIDVT